MSAKTSKKTSEKVTDKRLRGENHPRAKLCLKDVKFILKEIGKGKMPLVDLAQQFGVTPRTISNLKAGTTWTQVAR